MVDGVVVAVDGRRVHLDERYQKMVRWVVKSAPLLDGILNGTLSLEFNGASIGRRIERRDGPGALEHDRPIAASTATP